MNNAKEIKIDKNIPIVAKRGNYGVTYPFDKMEVGDSFYVKLKDITKASNQRSSLHSNANAFGLRRNPIWKFKTAFENEGIRIWRIK